ncbi:MAG: 1-phosphofructokinase family hexose kinase [Clostridia bacterium]|nr:1-phosphofructokinase family hexose kinase [Clostridiales bacterium]MDD7165720.1 1-phosphofructokinase family hexose kinase [Clostridia bacterium]MDY2900522.1 1-phosphofructokinase family hexose kinase [Christensenellaceae bacterium]
MILSVCPNPCVDCTIELDLLKVGGLNRIENKIITYSGKALNVAIGVSRLGGDSFATGFMFDENGKMFVHALDDENVKNTFVWNKGSARTNYKIVDKRSMMTEINDKGENVSPENQAELLSLVGELSKSASVVVMSGSLPGGVEDDYYLKLSSVIPANVKKILDTSGNKMIAGLRGGAFLIKPNLDELREMTGEHYDSMDEMVSGCERLVEAGAENVLLSLGRKGAILTDGDKAYFCKSATVAVNSTVGAGDGMVAAAAVMIEQNAPYDEILRCAVAAGTASVMTPGTNLFYRDKFMEIYDRIAVERIR